MLKKFDKSKRSVKKTISLVLCALLTVSCIGISASAADTRYSFSTDYSGSGDVWWLDTNKKEYKSVSVSCSRDSAKSSMALWKNWMFGDVHYDRDQTFSVGTGRRAWWYGDTSNTAQYHITATVSDNYNATVNYTGYFQTYT